MYSSTEFSSKSVNVCLPRYKGGSSEQVSLIYKTLSSSLTFFLSRGGGEGFISVGRAVDHRHKSATFFHPCFFLFTLNVQVSLDIMSFFLSRFILKLFLETWAFCACNVFCSRIFIFSVFVKAAFFHSFLALHGSRSVKERNEKSGLAKHKMLQSIFSLCVPLYGGVSSCSSVVSSFHPAAAWW